MCKDDLLESIQLGFKPDRDFFLKIYAYDLSYYNFKDHALNALNRIGYPDPWAMYAEVVTDFEKNQSAIFQRIAKTMLEGE